VLKISQILVFLLLCSCAGIRSRYHYVVSGDTLQRVAERYEVPLEELKDVNAEALASGVKPGVKLYIPFEASPAWDREFFEPTPAGMARGLATSGRFFWPVAGEISSFFGPRRATRRQSGYHEGLDIAAPRGTAVSAARSGHIIYSGSRIPGYGNMVIVRHADQFSTVYAHLNRLAVKKGQFVSRGQRLGSVGRSGKASGNHLHFEVRDGQEPVDPLVHLPSRYAIRRVGATTASR